MSANTYKPKLNRKHAEIGFNFFGVDGRISANLAASVITPAHISTLKRELVDTNAYKLQPSLSEKVVVNEHVCHTALHFGV